MAFRSPGARPSPRIQKQEIPDGPVQDFSTVIHSTLPEDWQTRTSALQRLVAMIPSSYEQNSNQTDWYDSPPTLRHLALPLCELLKDARSTVVKRTCESLNELFSKCRSNARYLLKDLMPTVCQVHGCTVQVIRNYVQNMMLATLPRVPCKMTMPVWLDRLKHDKSRTVREACSLYLTTAMDEWGASDDDDFENDNNGYLSREIYHQVGANLVKSLRDPSPIVRQNCKKGLEVLTSQKREVLDELISDRSLTRDLRVMKLLKRLQAGETGMGDEMSVSSRMSRTSIASAPAMPRGSSHSVSARPRRTVPPRGRYPGGASSYRQSPPSRVPTTIGVASPAVGLGPPRRMVNGISSPLTRKPSLTSKLLPKSPPLLATSKTLAAASPANDVDPSPRAMPLSTPTQKLLGTTTEKDFSTPVTPLEYEVEKSKTEAEDEGLVNQSFDSTDTDVSVLKPIATAEELRQKAKTRTKGTNHSRRSSLLQDRLLRSASKSKILLDDVDGSTKTVDENSNGDVVNIANMDVSQLSASEISDHPHLPIHTKIAYELLEAHKTHVDQIMETLKVEMDALKDFELIMLEKGPLRPTEEEVLEYFESLGLCLDQRKKAGSIMQKKMDRISQG